MGVPINSEYHLSRSEFILILGNDHTVQPKKIKNQPGHKFQILKFFRFYWIWNNFVNQKYHSLKYTVYKMIELLNML